MRYGLELPDAGPCGDARTLAELANIAEVSGWDGVFLEDYIVYYDPVPTYDPWVALAAMALRTNHIRLGTTVTPLARRRPSKLARELLTLDHLSNGRMILGVGLGGSEDFTRFGEPADVRHRAEMLDEGLAVLAGLWSGTRFSFQGKHYTVEETVFLPAPMQPGRIPVWIGGSAQVAAVVRRAAQWDGIVPYKRRDTEGWENFTPQDIEALNVQIARQRHTTTPFDIAILGPRDERLIASMREAGVTWWMEAIRAAPFATMREAIARGPLRGK